MCSVVVEQADGRAQAIEAALVVSLLVWYRASSARFGQRPRLRQLRVLFEGQAGGIAEPRNIFPHMPALSNLCCQRCDFLFAPAALVNISPL